MTKGLPRDMTDAQPLESPDDQQAQLALLVRLYQGSVDYLIAAETACQEEQFDRFRDQLDRGRKIIEEFQKTLDYEQGGEVAKQLGSLYEFVLNSLVQAELTYDPRYVRRSVQILTNLLEGWRAI